jgi:hypothetical protein
VWVVREALRLFERVAAGVAIAAAVGGLWSLTQHGSAHHRFQIAFLVVGGIVVALGAMGRGSSYERAADIRAGWRLRSLSGLMPQARPSEPRLAPGAVLLLTGAIVIALGFVV